MLRVEVQGSTDIEKNRLGFVRVTVRPPENWIMTTHVIMFEEAKHFQLPEDSFAAHETLKDVRQFF